MSPPDGYFESAAHRHLFSSFLHKRSLPLKFAYAGSAAFTHDVLAKSSSYQTVMAEATHEANVLASATKQQRRPVEIAEIGPGNGQHSIAFIGTLSTHELRFSRYLGLDFSDTLVRLATSAISRSWAEFDVSHGIWDFEETPTDQIDQWRCADSPILTAMLGHTLGNPDDPLQVLKNVLASVQTGDLLLLSVALLPSGVDDDALLAPYRTDVFKCAALEPLRAAGMDTDHAQFDLRLDQGRSIIADVVVPADFSFEAEQVLAGERITCFRSRRFTEDRIDELVSTAGWTLLAAETDVSGAHRVVLAVAP